MRIVIAKVDEVFFDGEAVSMTVPGAEGEMTVLGQHMPLITTLKKGTITVRQDGNLSPSMFDIESGVLEVRRDGATVIL
ncbi:MAG: F0F1 ATP synthase subunit epsilon [bacterium]|nr:F0F1 ATP synthase subunit epsilon [bacterium]